METSLKLNCLNFVRISFIIVLFSHRKVADIQQIRGFSNALTGSISFKQVLKSQFKESTWTNVMN
jgi:hypothetical protein